MEVSKTNRKNNPPVALTIAGSDSSAGAGVQADLKTFAAHGVYSLTAITCVVAEAPGKVSAISPISPEMVRDQIRLSMENFPVAAVKTGMLFSRGIIETICAELAPHKLPLVVDPVMAATSGDSLMASKNSLTASNDSLIAEDDFLRALEPLFLLATVVTPNLDEAAALLGEPIQTVGEMREAGSRLAKKFGTAILLKGGHLRGELATDLLFANGEVCEFSAPFISGVSTHGTGCAYSAAITAGLACGLDLKMAVSEAKAFISAAIAQHFRWESAAGKTDALNHFAKR